MHLKCRDTQVARGGASDTEGACHAAIGFQGSNAELAQIGTIAAINHANEHSGVSSMILAKLSALSGTVGARSNTSLNLLMIHGCLSGTSCSDGRCARKLRRSYGVISLQL
jgi:hypothetical protein